MPVYILLGGMAALLQGVPTVPAHLQAGRSSTGSRMKSTFPSLPEPTPPATPAIRAAFTPAPRNNLEYHLTVCSPLLLNSTDIHTPLYLQMIYIIASKCLQMLKNFWKKIAIPRRVRQWGTTGI